jgi:hypothetical protein
MYHLLYVRHYSKYFRYFSLLNIIPQTVICGIILFKNKCKEMITAIETDPAFELMLFLESVFAILPKSPPGLRTFSISSSLPG